MSAFTTDPRIDDSQEDHDSSDVVRRRCALIIDAERPAGSESDHEQVRALAELTESLSVALPTGWDVYTAYSRDRSSLADVIEEIITSGFEELVVVPLSPWYSPGTTGVAVRDIYQELAESGLHLNVAVRTAWFDDIGYINARARAIADHASIHGLTPDTCHLLFTASHIPGNVSTGDDPYEEQMQWTIRLISQRLGWPLQRSSIVLQTGLEPPGAVDAGLVDRIGELSDTGEDRVLVCSLMPVNIRPLPEGSGDIEIFECGGSGVLESLITSLKNIIIRGPRRITSPDQEPILVWEPERGPVDGDTGSLVMIGVSTTRDARSTGGPQLNHCAPDAFGAVKKHRKAILDCLDQVRENGSAEEAFVWNTCQRVEFYGWLNRSGEPDEHDRAIDGIRQIFFGSEGDGVDVNLFRGSEAWHHLMRTAAGLNSDLPGDTDVLAQLQTACRIAGHSEMKGPRSEALMESATRLIEAVRAETAWGRYATSYCHAALNGVEHEAGLRLDVGRHVVIGGSTTSHSILRTLADEYSVFGKRKTVVYRCHHGQMKLLRNALGDGRRLRVHAYSEESVIRAIADADHVYFGIDHPDPVLDMADLTGLRDFVENPLTIMDFNSFGSMAGSPAPEGVSIWTSEDLDRVVTTHVAGMASDEGFLDARQEADAWIEARVPEVGE
ncbi:ferrochelatase [Candidatus Zixiibacteriota bacterium]